MGYAQALEANGVVIKQYKEFGDYQGTWIALLEDGRFIEGSYGSCSGCDAFQAEFDYGTEELVLQEDGKYHEDNFSWNDVISNEQADEHNKKHFERLRTFGQGYLNSSETKEEIIKRYAEKIKDDEWAWEDDKQIFEWLNTL